ncbi:hypothetical protein MYXE_03750 [Mycobacterium xenopi]|uniref:Uncharacterized protein n=1 Tax=Mycobacterium xenopi TaxID=1789 RepID=A0AAD1LZP0_MYCXE|nr:hypothetical protein MYXE_03750 [Mycobacterium xenopi]
MILTGRTGLAALMGVLAIMVSPWPATSFAVLLTALAVAVVIDAGLAASPKAVRFDRFGAASARLGESVDAAWCSATTGAGVSADTFGTPGRRARVRNRACTP